VVAKAAAFLSLARQRLIHLLYCDQLCADQQVPKLKSDCDDTLPGSPSRSSRRLSASQNKGHPRIPPPEYAAAAMAYAFTLRPLHPLKKSVQSGTSLDRAATAQPSEPHAAAELS
jgi:hypothetical protein